MDPKLRMDPAAAHEELTLSRETLLLNGTWKIVVAQPDPGILAMKGDMPPKKNEVLGWRYRNHSWTVPDMSGCGLQFLDRTNFRPCVFDVQRDPREMQDLSQARPELLNDLWGRLNRSFLTWYHSRTPESMLGDCNKSCAKSHWRGMGSPKGDGPIRGVPGCVG